MSTQLPPRWLPAPMEGIMRGCFCPIAAEMGLVDGWLTNFFRVNSSGKASDRQLRDFLAPFFTTGIPVFVQLMGDDPGLIAETAQRMLELAPISGFDLNLGCPSHAVSRHPGVGGGVWKSPTIPLAVLRTLRQRLGSGIMLSLKCRTGKNDYKESLEWLPRWIDVGELNWISVHYRTVAEGYKPVDKSERSKRFAAVAGITDVPMWLNGDFADIAEAEAEIAKLDGKAHGALFGRGWLKAPGLFCGKDNKAVAEEFYTRAVNWHEGISPGQRIELGKWLLGKIIL